MGRGNDANIDRALAIVADPTHLVLLENAQ